ncbi:unnamed protein product, partial [Mesorhabditis spiculigera]
MMKLLLTLCLVAAALLEVSARMQNVTVTGIAVCQKKRLSNVKIELWDRDTLDPNDLLSTVFTNGDGEFTITGGEDEVGKIEPFIRVTHNCKTKPYCQRIGDFEVPQEKIDGTYDMTYLTLDIAVSGEKEKCM